MHQHIAKTHPTVCQEQGKDLPTRSSVDIIKPSPSLPKRQIVLSRQPSERSRRKLISTHAVRTVKSTTDFSYNCLPWYYKKLVVFQINELRRRLEYLHHDSHHGATGRILPSSIPQSLLGSFQKRKDKRDDKSNLGDRRTSSGKDDTFSSSLCSLQPQDEKENRAIFDAVIKKRETVLRVITGRRISQKRRRDEGKKHVLSLSTSSSKSSTWYVRPMKGIWTEPAYCSMEMISFDKESECFHRTEIAYPFRPSFCCSTENCNNFGKDAPSCRLAKKLEIRTRAVKNIYKHSLIWD
jgi:hypothetical protein